MRFFLLLLVAFGSLQAMSKAPSVHVESVQQIGVRTFSYQDEARDRPVVVELWYPADPKAPALPSADSPWIQPKEARDATLSRPDHKHPLILMSHGHKGDRRDRTWLVQYLVHNGFIVASVEHHGDSWISFNPAISLRFWERAKDISFALTEILKEPSLNQQIDSEQVGFVGYSLGGMTGLALAGAQAKNVKTVVEMQQARYKQIDPHFASQTDFTEGHKNYTDPRIKAMVLLSPASFVYPESSLKQIKLPIAIVASEGDEVLPFKEHAMRIIKHLIPAKVKMLKKTASHYVFLNYVSKQGHRFMGEEIRTEAINTDRAEVHQEVGSFTVDFFKEQFFTE